MENAMKDFRFCRVAVIAVVVMALTAGNAVAQVVFSDPESGSFSEIEPFSGDGSEDLPLPAYLELGPAIGAVTEFAVEGPTGGIGVHAEGGFLHMMVVGPNRDAHSVEAGCAPVVPREPVGQCMAAVGEER